MPGNLPPDLCCLGEFSHNPWIFLCLVALLLAGNIPMPEFGRTRAVFMGGADADVVFS